MEREAAHSLSRLLPRLKARLGDEAPPALWLSFRERLEANFERLFIPLRQLYGGRYDFFYHLEGILELAARCWLGRPEDLRRLDAAREADPDWFQSARMMGAVCYLDRFAGDLAGLRERLAYLRELGITYLHLMPLFRTPAGDNDGGYAVSSYREVDARLGTMAELAALFRDLRRAGISPVLDFVFNHTSDEHEWARRALAGDPDYQDFYLIFPDRELPDAYEAHLREIFPQERPGSFTYRPEIGRWVWTTFHSFQWDLNYANPAVFSAMAEEMLFLANQGVEVLRLDAVVFIWKRLGTSCENLPEAHLIIRAFNALARIAAPALLFKSEAIVHPDDIASFISPEECQLSYNPLLMALLWEALATRDVRLLRESMRARLRINPRTAWVNYVRCHDDIGWTFDNGDAERLGIDPVGHRQFLNAFYTGRFPGSFARGLPFQENPRTGDARVSGTAASLAGLEKALYGEGPAEVDLAIRRILLLHSVILSIGGIPLLYLGDEVGMLNDYRHRNDPATAADSRWVHRPRFDWEAVGQHANPDTPEGRISAELRRLIRLRQQCPGFSGITAEIIDPGNDHIFGYVRQGAGGRVLVLANVTEREQTISANQLRLRGLAYRFTDLVTGETLTLANDLSLEPYRFVWLVPE